LLGRAEGGRMSSGYWFKEADANGGTRIINISQLNTDGAISEVSLYEFRSGQELTSMSQAARGKFTGGALHLSEVTQTIIDDTSVAALADGQPPSDPVTRVEYLPERTLSTTLTPER